MTASQANYLQTSQKTIANLKSMVHSLGLSDVSQLSLPELENVSNQIGQVLPAGNVPGVILNGLVRLPDRKPSPKNVRRDINLLFKGVRQALDAGTYVTMFAGPAAAIWAYQKMLEMSGKHPDDAFPEGTWQFYVDYALREDTARHMNEAHGFDTDLTSYGIHLNPVDRVTAWLMACIHCLHQYPNLLENEWRERVYLDLLTQVTAKQPDASRYQRLRRTWTKELPYRREQDAGQDEAYPAYRRRKFDEFLERSTANLPQNLRQIWHDKIKAARKENLAGYQQQMSMLAYLEPAIDGETRVPLSLSEAKIGLIHQGQYYLLPICAPDSQQAVSVETIRAHVAAIFNAPASEATNSLIPLAKVQRNNWPEIYKTANKTLLYNLEALRTAPIIFNADTRPAHLPLVQLRQTERGVGDHPLTLFDTGETIAMDQSHIFFDGAWGAALVEILANEAISWGIYLNALGPSETPSETSSENLQPKKLHFPLEEADKNLLQSLSCVTPEVSAETDKVKLKSILNLRKVFKRRNDLLNLTVNDLLVLYRAIHAFTYQPSEDVLERLQTLKEDERTRSAAQTALNTLNQAEEVSPALVIPVDASSRKPSERLYPITFEVPLQDLDILNLHHACANSLYRYRHEDGDRTAAYEAFNKAQRTYLATLAGFGEVLSKAKDIAISGESASVGAIKMLAHMPTSLQRLLDQIPSRIDILNDLIKGREVFSNVGAVVSSSTLTRFITAKDDNEKKDLAWGIITDAQGVMRVSLRDFRPHVRALLAVGQAELAQEITQDYLNAYAEGLNKYIKELAAITKTSRETRLHK